MKWLLSLLVLSGALLAASEAQAQACTGASPNWTVTSGALADLEACINLAAVMNGDTVTVAPGKYTIPLGTRIAITKFVKIVGDGVIYTDNSCNGQCPNVQPKNLITITESSAGSIEMSGFYFIAGTGYYVAYGNGLIGVIGVDGAQPILIHDNGYDVGGLTSADFMQWGSGQGVVYRNTMTAALYTPCRNQLSFLRHKQYINLVWFNPPPIPWGALDTTGTGMLYIQGNTLQNIFQGIDSDDYSLLTYNHNTLIASVIITHGQDSSNTGGLGFDVFNNEFIQDQTPLATCAGDFPDMVTHIGWRNGTGLIHHNRIDTPGRGRSSFMLAGWPPRRNQGALGCWGTRTGFPPSVMTHYPRQTGSGPGADIAIGPFTQYNGGASASYTQSITPIYFWSNTGTGASDVLAASDNTPPQGCSEQVASYDTLVGGSGYSDATNVAVTGGTGADLLVNITTTGGAVTGLTLLNGMLSRGYGYAVGDVLTISGGNNDASFRVSAIKWSDQTGDLPTAAQYILAGREFLANTAYPGYQPYPHCPHDRTGLSGQCASQYNGAGFYNVPASGPYLAFSTEPLPVITGSSFQRPVAVQISTGNADQIAISAEPMGQCQAGGATGATGVVSAPIATATFSGLNVTAVPGTVCRLRAHNNSATMPDVVSNPFIIRAIPPGTMVFSQPPTTTSVGNPFFPAVSVTVSTGNPDSLTISVSPGDPCTLQGGTMTVTANAMGNATFTGLTPTTAGHCRLRVINNTDMAIAPIDSPYVDVLSTGVSNMNLISYWKMDETASDAPAVDSCGMNTLQVMGMIASNVGLINTAREGAPGANYTNYLYAASSPSIAPSGSFTWSFWYYPLDRNNSQLILGKLVHDPYVAPFPDDGAFSFMITNQQFFFTVRDQAGMDHTVSTPIGRMSQVAWYHIIAWYDADAHSLNIQLRLTTQNDTYTVDVGAGFVPIAAAGFLSMLGGPYVSVNVGGGNRLDEVAYFQRVLTADERSLLFNNGAGLPYSNFACVSGPASVLNFIQQPTNTVSGQPFNPAVLVDIPVAAATSRKKQ